MSNGYKMSPDQIQRIQRAEQYTTQIAIQLGNGNYEAAERELRWAIGNLRNDPLHGPIAEVPIECLRMSPPLLGKLRETLDCQTLGQLRRLPPSKLSVTPNIGPMTIDDIWDAIFDLADRRGQV